jgi:predicted glycosyltransferase
LKILIYCQHVWGLGHLFRTLAIARALKDHDVVLVTGGPEMPLPLPRHVRRFQLPGLRMQADRQLVGTDGRAAETVWPERIACLHERFRTEAPDVFLVELYPLGRTAFGRELNPLLERIRSGGRPRCRVYCSVRDILVEKRDTKAYEDRVGRRLNRWFDALLVHADPSLIALDATFTTLAAIKIPVVYTGYVARPSVNGSGRAAMRRQIGLPDDEKLIIVSAGGGQSGYPLLAAALELQRQGKLPAGGRMALFTGPYLPEAHQAALQAAAAPGVVIRRFSDDFRDWLGAADLSISMAGYNTCMDILTTGVPALVWPYAGDREQPLRAARLAEKGWLSVLEDVDLAPEPLGLRIAAALTPAPRPIGRLDLQGAVNTVRFIETQHRTRPLTGGREGLL